MRTPRTVYAVPAEIRVVCNVGPHIQLVAHPIRGIIPHRRVHMLPTERPRALMDRIEMGRRPGGVGEMMVDDDVILRVEHGASFPASCVVLEVLPDRPLRTDTAAPVIVSVLGSAGSCSKR